MLNKAVFLTVLISVCIISIGCQEKGSAITAAEIAQEAGILNENNDDTAIVSIIQSGQADKMLEKGHMKVAHEIREGPGGKVLVTQYLIGGEPYRIEVRRQVKPMKNVALRRVRQMKYSKETTGRYISRINKLYHCLQENSFEAQPEVAYRAWKGLDGKVRRIELSTAPEQQWVAHENDLNLYIRTREWPLPVMWFRGLTSDGRRRPLDGFLNYDRKIGAIASESQDTRACDGRWIMESPGPGIPCPPFINTELYDTIMACASKDPLDALSISDGHGMVQSNVERRRRIDAINDMLERELQDDWDWFWLYDRNSRLSRWELNTP